MISTLLTVLVVLVILYCIVIFVRKI